MLDHSQQKRVARKCTTTLLGAIARFEALLAKCEPDQAAAIIADLIKAQLSQPQAVLPPPSIEEIMNAMPDDDEEEEGEWNGRDWNYGGKDNGPDR